MRLEVTRKSDLSVRALCWLNRQSERKKGSELAEQIGASPGFLAQALAPLVRAGWVLSDPGPTGGYSLGTPLEEISLLAVIEQIEGPTDNGQCVLVGRPCSEEGPCVLHETWSRARDHLLEELDSLSLADVAAAGLMGCLE